MNSSILTVNELTKKYYSKSVNLFNKKTSANKALDKVSFSLFIGAKRSRKKYPDKYYHRVFKAKRRQCKVERYFNHKAWKKIPQNFGIYATATNFVQFFYRQAIFALYVRP